MPTARIVVRPVRRSFATLCAPALALTATAMLAVPAWGQSRQDIQPTEAAPIVDESEAGTYPTPDAVTRDWQLQFTYQKPGTVPVEIDGETVWYWYMPYEVLNATSEPILFVPSVTVLTDAGHVIAANRGIPLAATAAVKRALRDELVEGYPEIVGEMLPGRDYAKRGAIIWPVPEEDVDAMSIFVTGIYGETKPVIDPETGEPQTRPATDVDTGEVLTDDDGNELTEVVMARRTLQLTFKTPGTAKTPRRVVVVPVDRRDVMR